MSFKEAPKTLSSTVPTVLLALDGGGARGVMPIVCLMRLEKLLRELSGDPHALVRDYVDIIAGTSSGAIVSSLLLHPDGYDMATILDIFRRESKEIFRKSLWREIWSARGLLWNRYRSAPLEELIERRYGDSLLSSFTKPFYIPVFDTAIGLPFLFSSKRAAQDPSNDFLIKDTIRAAVAAPSYFSGKRVESQVGGITKCLIDGGVFANNPAAVALGAEMADKEAQSLGDFVVMSLGTGQLKYATRFEQSSHWGGLKWASRIIDVQIEATSTATHRQLKRFLSPERYLRLNPALYQANIPAQLDNCSDTYLDRLTEVTYHELEKKEAELLNMAKLLVER